MRSRFPKPAAPMGEAWFMGEKRKIFDDLMTNSVAALPVKYLFDCLWEITGGLVCFGNEDSWIEWFRYLLPDLILRAHEQHTDYLLEATVTAFMAVFPQGLDTEYRGLQQDIRDTLSVSLMKPDFWTPHEEFPHDPSKRLPRFLLEESQGKLFVDYYGFTKASPELSAALHFCLKYLTTADIPSWVDSILQIEHSQWRAGLLVWLLGAKQLLLSEPWTPAAIEKRRPEIKWANSHWLDQHWRAQGRDQFISSANVETFVREFRSRFKPVTLDQWELQLIDDRRLSDLPGFDQLMEQIRSMIA